MKKPKILYSDMDSLSRDYFTVVGQLVEGRHNATFTASLNTSTASTTISSTYASPTCHVAWSPMSVEAVSAGSTMWVKTRTNGSVVLAHATTGTSLSRTFSISITGSP